MKTDRIKVPSSSSSTYLLVLDNQQETSQKLTKTAAIRGSFGCVESRFNKHINPQDQNQSNGSYAVKLQDFPNSVAGF